MLRRIKNSKRKRSKRSAATRRLRKQRGGVWSTATPTVWIPARPSINPFLLPTNTVSVRPEYANLASTEPIPIMYTQIGNGTLGFKNGLVSQAQINAPSTLAFDKKRNILYFYDIGNRVIRKVSPDSIVSTYAGLGGSRDETAGTVGYVDGPITIAQFGGASSMAGSMAVDSIGNLYLSDSYMIRMVSADGTTVSTYAGNSTTSGYIDGSLSTATFTAPNIFGVNSSNNMYVQDGTRIRYIYNNSNVLTVTTLFTLPVTDIRANCLIDSSNNIFVFLFVGPSIKMYKYTILTNGNPPIYNALSLQMYDFGGNYPFRSMIDEKNNIYWLSNNAKTVYALSPPLYNALNDTVNGAKLITLPAIANSMQVYMITDFNGFSYFSDAGNYIFRCPLL